MDHAAWEQILAERSSRIIDELAALLERGEGTFRFSLSQGHVTYIIAIHVDKAAEAIIQRQQRKARWERRAKAKRPVECTDILSVNAEERRGQ